MFNFNFKIQCLTITWNIFEISGIILRIFLRIFSVIVNICRRFYDKLRANNCERFERESGSRYMSDLGQVSVIITGWTGMQCLIAAFYPSCSPILFSARTYSLAIFRGGHSSPEEGTKKHLFLLRKHYSVSAAIIIVLKLDMVTGLPSVSCISFIFPEAFDWTNYDCSF